MRTIVLDPGHGGPDPGAVGVFGLTEAEVTLDVVVRLGRYLTSMIPGAEIIQTHQGAGASLRQRTVIANDAEADRFVSIHCNAAENREAHGYEVWTSRGETPADELATKIFEQLAHNFPDLRGRQDPSDGDPDKEAGFYVLRHTAMPAVLVELAFISNSDEEQLLAEPINREVFAFAVASGIRNSFA